MTERPRRNIELKARCPDLNRARAAAESVGATFSGVLKQTDTYYCAQHGRLKLREINDDRAELIWYFRPQHAEARPSDYHITPIPLESVAALKVTLTSALRVRGIVSKRRELWLWHNVRIHLDEVDELGTFIEYEAVIGTDVGEDEATAHKRLAELCESMNVRGEDRVAESYSDLLGI